MRWTDHEAVAHFVEQVKRTLVADPAHLKRVLREARRDARGRDPVRLASHLVQRGVLTGFQVDQLFAGKGERLAMGPFRLCEPVGSGSLGTVYKARSSTDGGWYAVKVLPRRSLWSARLAQRKVHAFGQCRHPAVVRFADAGTAGALHYLAWPFVAGEPLDRFIGREGRRPPGEAASLALQIAEGLEVCHRQNLFHGLLKPSNLLVDADGRVQIVDFGIGCLLAEAEEESLVDTCSTVNAITAGLDWASPESVLEPTNLNARGDQYSLGCVLYHCLAGHPPFPDRKPAEKMTCHLRERPPALREVNPAVPAGLADIVGRLMAKEPGERFGGMADLIEALRPFATSPLPSDMLQRKGNSEQGAGNRGKTGALPRRPSDLHPAFPCSLKNGTPRFWALARWALVAFALALLFPGVAG